MRNNFYKVASKPIIASCFILFVGFASGQTTDQIIIVLDTAKPGRAIPQGFVGLSVEMATVCSAKPDTSSTRNPATANSQGCNSDSTVPGANEGMLGTGSANKSTSAAVQKYQNEFNKLVQDMGIKNVRVGGTTADSLANRTPVYAYPPLQTAKNVVDWGNTVGLTELEWDLPVLGADVPTYSNYAASLLKYARDHYPNLKLIFETGNEDDQVLSYSKWLSTAQNYISTIYNKTSSPYLNDLYFATPSTASVGSGAPTDWYMQMIANRYFTTNSITNNKGSYQIDGIKSLIANLNVHDYPNGGGYTSPCLGPNQSGKGTTCLSLVKELLSLNTPNWGVSVFAKNVSLAGFAPRLMETNSMFNGGVEGAGDSYAAALWTLDYISSLAQNANLAGLNLHTGATGGYSLITPPSPYFNLGSDPILKAGGYGAMAYTHFTSPNGRIITPAGRLPNRVTAYASLQDSGQLNLLVINRNWTDNGNQAVTITVTVPSQYTSACTMSLRQAASDPTSLTGISLGGASVNSDGSWSGAWTNPVSSNSDGTFTFTVPPVQATIMQFIPEITTSLGDVADAYIQDGPFAGDNFGAPSTLIVKNDGPGYARKGYLKFSLANITAPIVSAKIYLTVISEGQPGIANQAYFVSDDSWTKSGITWNNAPATSTLLASWSVPATGAQISFDVTAQAQTAQRGNGLLSLAIVSPTIIGSNGWVRYGARENPTLSYQPRIVVATSQKKRTSDAAGVAQANPTR